MPDNKTKRVYYLTGAMTGIAALAMSRLKVSRFSELNDPFELLGVNLADRDVRRAFQSTRDKVNQDQGMLCFTTNWMNPLMWGHYAENHKGMALGFDVPADRLTTVTYAKKMFDFKLDPATRRPAQGTVDRLMATKFYDWRYEKEVRIWVSLDHDAAEGGLHFVSFSEGLALREVVLGPRCTYNVEGLRTLTKKLYEHPVEVTQSRIAFTRFEVLENKAATRADASLGD